MSDREKKEWRFINREFLNDPTGEYHSQAYFIGRVEDTSFSKRSTKTTPTIRFDLSDCSHIISLFFNLQDTPGIANTRYKLEALRRNIDNFCDALEAELVLREERIARTKKPVSKRQTELRDMAAAAGNPIADEDKDDAA